MKIYSIKEIVKATNDLYERANNSDLNNKNLQNKKKENEPLILTDEIREVPKKIKEVSSDNKIPPNTKKIIEEAEISKQKQKNKSEKYKINKTND